MFDLIRQIINHTWQTSTTGDQQIIYYIAGTMIIIFSIMIVDVFRRLFAHFIGK